MILKPSQETFRDYLQKKRDYDYQEKELLKFKGLEAVTLDGVSLDLRGNIDFVEEIATARELGAQGIGLFRTEFLFMFV